MFVATGEGTGLVYFKVQWPIYKLMLVIHLLNIHVTNHNYILLVLDFVTVLPSKKVVISVTKSTLSLSFTSRLIESVIFWVIVPCSMVVDYQHIRRHWFPANTLYGATIQKPQILSSVP
jgi:hypothetical protein